LCTIGPKGLFSNYALKYASFNCLTDEETEFSEGDLLPRPVLRTPEDSGADIMANGSFENGRWTLEMRRRLNTGNADDKAMQEGQVYRMAFAIFDDNVSNRRHHVSFVKTVGLGVDADIRAEKIKYVIGFIGGFL
jgi:hypothetical protein